MQLQRVFLILLSVFIGCSSLSKKSQPHPIGLSDVQKIHMGKSNTSELRQHFGEPNEITSDEQGNDFWIYNDYLYGTLSERVKFKVDRKSGLVINGIWSPDDSSGYSTTQELLEYFKGFKLVKEKAKQPKDRHYFADNDSYYDFQAGISILTMSKDSVFVVGFSVPQESRLPAQEQKYK